MSGPTPRERLAELFAKVDAFFERAAARYPAPGGVTCHAGCDECCRRRFSVTALEAEIVSEALAALEPGARSTLAARAKHGDPGVCPALGERGECGIYAARPLICRSHGLPIRFMAPSPLWSSVAIDSAPSPRPSRARDLARRFARPGAKLPIVDACPKNFTAHDLASLDPSLVLDQTTVSTVLGALDAARARERGEPTGERVEIATLLAGERAS